MAAPTAKILIVDDEAGIRFSMAETLTRDEYEVVAVDSGEAALDCLAVHEFDLVLIDLMLSGMGGLEVLAWLRSHAPDTVAIMLTAHASLETAVGALRQGAHDYLFKPCKTAELRDSISRGLLHRQRAVRQSKLLGQLEQLLTTGLNDIRATVNNPTVTPPPLVSNRLPEPAHAPDLIEEQGRFLRHAGLIVDVVRHVVTLNGRLLELSPTEFNLLAYLAQEAPRVISPPELVRQVQGYDSEQWEAGEMVRYHIYRLRNKIKEAAGNTSLIHTVRGVGYTLGE